MVWQIFVHPKQFATFSFDYAHGPENRCWLFGIYDRLWPSSGPKPLRSKKKVFLTNVVLQVNSKRYIIGSQNYVMHWPERIRGLLIALRAVYPDRFRAVPPDPRTICDQNPKFTAKSTHSLSLMCCFCWWMLKVYFGVSIMHYLMTLKVLGDWKFLGPHTNFFRRLIQLGRKPCWKEKKRLHLSASI